MPKMTLSPSMQREREVSATLKKALIDKGWTNQHLAQLLCMNAGNLSRIMNHPMSVRLDTIFIIAKKLGVTSLNIK